MLAAVCFVVVLLMSDVISIIANPIVVTELGAVRGSVMSTRFGVEFNAFRGIPYAEPPVGYLRWKAPMPVKPWHDVFDATQDGPICPQVIASSYNSFLINDVMSEDCLRLNVYTKYSNTSVVLGQNAVLVFIHGGSFLVGANSQEISMPTYLMERDIVYVSINYRLGALGFLSSGTKDVPGNAGMKDQVLALKWIKSNIVHFGGDPNRITLLGHSAGAISVNLHMVSPMSRDLFHRAIVMSGSATLQNNFISSDQNDLVVRYGALLNCSVTTPAAVFECIKDLPYSNLVAMQDSLAQYGMCPLLSFLPIVEPALGHEQFLEQNPIQALKSGNWNKVPVMTGFSKDEFAALAYQILKDRAEWFYTNFDEVAPACFMYDKESHNLQNISHMLKSQFLPGPLRRFKSLHKLQILIGDAIISVGNHRLVKLIWNQTDVFYYKSSYVGRFSRFYYPYGRPYGVEHEDDLQYLLELPEVSPQFTLDDPESTIVEIMTRLWSNFVINGNPNNSTDEYIHNITWPIYEGQSRNYLEISDKPKVKRKLYEKRLKIWDELLPLL